MNTQQQITSLVKKAIERSQKAGELPKFKIPKIEVEKSAEKIYGDYATSVALKLAKIARKGPHDISYLISNQILAMTRDKHVFEKIEVVHPGFINFFLDQHYLQKNVQEILKTGSKYGSSNIGRNKKIQIEFISANPTGPLTVANGRGGFFGDTLANVLEKSGFKVIREYYINDAGRQVRLLGESAMASLGLISKSEDHYQGDYVNELAKKHKKFILANKNDSLKTGKRLAGDILKTMIKPPIKKMGIKFDVWFSESSLHGKGKLIEKVFARLKKKKLIYEKEGAEWFKSTSFGDDKDRVLKTSEGEWTYAMPDIAYHYNKFAVRKFNKVINIWGADHHGYVPRLKAALSAFDFAKKLDVVIVQLVRLMEKGQEVRMSKRKGTYVTIDDLLDEVGPDVARFFFLMSSVQSHMDFDLTLAKEKSEKNPVFYVQYAHARICSILKKANIRLKAISYKPSSRAQTEGLKADLSLLTHHSELELMKELLRFSEIVQDVAENYTVNHLPTYALELAAKFHAFYRDCRVISEDKEITASRLALVRATKIVLANTLELMGIKAPERM
ncbi:arginine--tRNA ligase [Candidatus Azambacteria bacterium RIFCSPHIGHO2_01_46_10]|uniref:Arginine--tRNA ligase n=1 Tax=Candidatus Azambacteria bacterium RIFCSPHIGHO2_01_46_10 TaxID=1797293 RepID=A0A1F5BXM2_9BACT|nr:MAG: arginine--tRNA ligase [Candidatus Azambacteria bacterium RIFCSPHIGHO2_01_46_10]